ncbi:TonB-dependent siderophore receptor [Acidovorax sp. MR-S7]|uniref:TonB-dependent receptor n=1 Tax=Acidovorax sp. MR-S7 TaxID=1268622 RepID=UPI000369B89F|nr:TonB-dependent receptor [Acidovorax sp. MR-S7]GAD22061.1 outer membrane receptor proteins, mostly Fe transport [Acidovorax sp. MR-S7]
MPTPKSRAFRGAFAVPFLTPLLAAQPALAQTAATLPPVIVTADPSLRLERATSTGSNLDLTPLQTPASIEVIDRQQLESRGDATVMDAITRATGISSMGHPGNSGSALSARGFTDATSIMRLYDGTRQYGNVSVSFPFDTWSVERIEVLRGPASVIHGDGAIGGVINIVPRKPTRGPIRSEIQATVGTDGKRALAYGSGGSISDVLSYRLDVSGDRSDGWVARGDSRNVNFSGAVQLDVSPDLQVKFSHAQGQQKPMRYAGIPMINGGFPQAIREQNYNVLDSAIEYRDRWSELAVQWTPNAGTLVRSKLYHIGSDRYWRNTEAFTYNPATGLIDRADNTEIGHDQYQVGNTTDASFTGRLFGLPNQVSVGFDINKTSFQHTNNTYAGTSPSVDPFDPVPGYYSSPFLFIPRYRNRAEQHALFAEDRIEISDRLSLVGGLRYDSARVDRQNLIAGTQDFAKTYSSVGARLGAVYMVRPDTSVYGQLSRAADPARSLMFMTAANSVYDFTMGRQVEIGIKQSILDKKGEWSLAAYHIAKKNLMTRDNANPSLWIQVGQQSTRGIEGALSLPVASTVQLDANVALLKARYDDFTESVGGAAVSRVRNAPPNVPKRQANLWLGWKALPGWTISGGLRYVGERFANSANTILLPSYTTADLAVQWQVRPDTTLTLRGANVFDRYYFTTAYYSGTQWLVGEGRRIELTVNHKF